MKTVFCLVCLLLLTGFYKIWSKTKFIPTAKRSLSVLTDSLKNGRVIYRIQISSGYDADSSVFEIPFLLVGNLIAIEAELNEKKGLFILDSGAPDLKINAVHFPNSGLEKQSLAKGITGEVASVSMFTVDKFIWSEILLEDVAVDAFDLSHIEKVKNFQVLGLIGYKVFKDYQMMINYKNSKLVFYKLDDKGEVLRWRYFDTQPDASIPFTLVGHLPILKIQIDKYQLRFGLDTGAETNVIDIRNSPKMIKQLQILKRSVLHGNGGRQIEVLQGKIPLLKVENMEYHGMRMVLTNLENMNKAFHTELDGILGFDFLNYRKTAINYKKKELYLWENKKNIKQ